MQSLYKYIFAVIGLVLGMAVLVILIVADHPDTRLLIMLLALGMTSQGITLIDVVGEKKEQREKQN